MSKSRISVKIEIEPTGDHIEDVMNAFEDALESVAPWSEEEGLFGKFFTIRFDKTDRDTIAATVTASDKKGN